MHNYRPGSQRAHTNARAPVQITTPLLAVSTTSVRLCKLNAKTAGTRLGAGTRHARSSMLALLVGLSARLSYSTVGLHMLRLNASLEIGAAEGQGGYQDDWGEGGVTLSRGTGRQDA